MIVCIADSRPLRLRSSTAALLLALGVGLGGCAEMGDSVSTAFADRRRFPSSLGLR
jgi:hypothetical protein